MLVVKQQIERESANHQVAPPSVKTDCMKTNLPFDPTSALPVRFDHPSISTGDTGLPLDELFEPPPPSETFQVGNGDEENGFVTATSATKEPVFAVEILTDSDCLETHEECDLTTVVLANKGKGINPREYGGALYDPNSMIVPAGTTSTGGSDSIELIGVHQDKGMSFQELQGIPRQSFKRTRTTDLNDEGLPYDPTLPRPSWHPKISPYRFIVFSIPLAIGTVKAVISQKGSATTPITLEWISGVVIFLV